MLLVQKKLTSTKGPRDKSKLFKDKRLWEGGDPVIYSTTFIQNGTHFLHFQNEKFLVAGTVAQTFKCKREVLYSALIPMSTKLFSFNEDLERCCNTASYRELFWGINSNYLHNS